MDRKRGKKIYQWIKFKGEKFLEIQQDRGGGE